MAVIVAVCADPGVVQNAIRTDDRSQPFTTGTSVTYVCQNGFTIQGGRTGQVAATIVCQNNGQWTTIPVCTAITPISGILSMCYILFTINITIVSRRCHLEILLDTNIDTFEFLLLALCLPARMGPLNFRTAFLQLALFYKLHYLYKTFSDM